MGEERAVCPYCQKYSAKLYKTGSERQRERIRCEHCGRQYNVVYGSGMVKTEKI